MGKTARRSVDGRLIVFGLGEPIQIEFRSLGDGQWIYWGDVVKRDRQIEDPTDELVDQAHKRKNHFRNGTKVVLDVFRIESGLCDKLFAAVFDALQFLFGRFASFCGRRSARLNLGFGPANDLLGSN